MEDYVKLGDDGQFYVDFDALSLVAPQRFVENLKLFVGDGYRVVHLTVPLRIHSHYWLACLEDDLSVACISQHSDGSSYHYESFSRRFLEIMGYKK
ncbi:hypothetical protein P4S91_09070 [Aneurinibacillus aneurinilyticus]|uniref:hypothetical protein n=1 Tax=Aneurinibacillus aneurinilyticus TaxID=1391 RepID=UPI0023F365FA|nr:hypothetical protein [Aneurinibacillus aneurinilyticus]MED0709554.1 hypothetical protein [Aneurinibacillus aneurinilyticus]MED0723064.1 hypothetical protein [Aneurinibacillus aneurinilyticus]